MKKINLRLLGNIFISIIIIFMLINIGLTNKLGFDDTGSSKDSLILTTKGNMDVVEINGINVEDTLIRVENDKLYNEVVFSYYDEYTTFESFTFYSSYTDAAFSISYASNVDEIYLDRDFSIIKGYHTISLLMLLVLLFQIIYYLAFLGSFKRNNIEDNEIYKYNIFKRIMSVQDLQFTITIILSTLLFYLTDFFTEFFIFIYGLTDTQVVYILILYISILLLISAYWVFYRNNYKFEFLDDSLNLKRKNKTIFSSSYKDLVVDEVVIKGPTAKQGFIKMHLILNSRNSNTSPINVDFRFMEYDEFSRLVERLHSLAETDVIEPEKILTNEDIIIFARKEDNLFLYSSFLVILLFTLTVFAGEIFFTLSPLILVLIFSLFLIPYFFLTFRFIIRKPKEFQFVINKSGIEINGELIHHDEIKKIKMTKPTLYSTNSKILNIKKMIGREKYMITHNLLKPETDVAKMNYNQLYLTMESNFGDIFN